MLIWQVSPAAERPNILPIYADDLGNGDMSCYNPERGTPRPSSHIDSPFLSSVHGSRVSDGLQRR